MNPPESYIQEVLDSGFTYDQEVADTINVDDHQELQHMREWCTHVPNKQDRTFEEECLKICTQLGHYLCNSVPEKIEPTNDCKGNEDECQCCCKVGKVIFEKNCLLKSFLGCHSPRATSHGAGPGIALLQQRKLQRAQLQKTCQLLKIVPQMVLLRATTTMKMMTALMTLSPEQDQVITCIVFSFSVKICSFLIVMSNSNWRENPSVEEESSK